MSTPIASSVPPWQSAPPTPRERAALLLGRVARAVVRRLGRSGGTAIPGLVAGALAPRLVERLALQPGRGVVTVTGTNGKTTTTHLLTAVVRAAGIDPLTNPSGSNLERGLITAYSAEVDGQGRLPDAADRIGLFEVDEAALARLMPRLRPRVAVFLNLFRDQLDRYGEVDSVAEGWARALDEDDAPPTLVLNADDPSIAQLAEHGARAGRIVTFGVDDDAVALTHADHASDARFCTCGSRFIYDAIYMGHVGRWHCSLCGRARPTPVVSARRIVLREDGSTVEVVIAGEAFTFELPLAGLYSAYNALAAIAAAHALGIDAPTIASALAQAGPAFGRQERFEVGGRRVRLLLAKNPAGLNEVLRVLTVAEPPLTVLAMLNDGVQDGQDVSWIYDADLEMLAGIGATIVCAGDRADDLALRCALAGAAPVAVIAHTERALDAALARTPPGGRLDVVATYTAMLDVREALARRAGVGAYWEAQP
ncbi:MAG: Mur ligase family protein [Chloroflexi bacterium]|nr:MAG: Mur ligase family protein [Chloroflexota bacterium]